MASKRIKKKARTAQRLPGRKYWLAVGTLAAYSATGTGKLALAKQKIPPSGSSQSSIQGLPVRRFDIPAGFLDGVAKKFTEITGVKVTERLEGIFAIYSPGVKVPSLRSKHWKK
jgi:catecholate siderophore receptor